MRLSIFILIALIANVISCNIIAENYSPANIHSEDPAQLSRVVVGYKKNSAWSQNRHWIELESTPSEETCLMSQIPCQKSFFIIDMGFEELGQFHLPQGTTFIILEETADSELFHSIFSIIFDHDNQIYESKGNSIKLSRKDFEPYTITNIYKRPNAYGGGVLLKLNHYPNVNFEVITSNQGINDEYFYAGMSLTFDSEQFIPSSPGISHFMLHLADEKNITASATSLDSHWTPSAAQFNHSLKADAYGSIYVDGYDYFMIILEDGRKYAVSQTRRAYHDKHADVEVGDKLVEVAAEKFVNLRTAEVLYSLVDYNDVSCFTTERSIKRTW